MEKLWIGGYNLKFETCEWVKGDCRSSQVIFENTKYLSQTFVLFKKQIEANFSCSVMLFCLSVFRKSKFKLEEEEIWLNWSD